MIQEGSLDLSTLGSSEKSALFARLMGKATDCNCGDPSCKFGKQSKQRTGKDWFLPDTPDVYAPANVGLAKEVMMWAELNLMQGVPTQDIWRFGYTFTFHSVPLALDGVLRLAIESGKVTNELLPIQ